MTNGLPEVPENFYWEVKPTYIEYTGYSSYTHPAQVHLVAVEEPGEWEPFNDPPAVLGVYDCRSSYDDDLYDYAFQPKGWKKGTPPLTVVASKYEATHVRKNTKYTKQSGTLSDRWTQEELIRVAADTLELYHIRTAQSEMYGTYPPKTL